MNTEMMIDFFESNNLRTGIDKDALSGSLQIASEIFI
jgi:hypothetical protein